MKKIYIFFCFCIGLAYAQDILALECSIQNQTAPPLQKYFDNLEKISGNFSAQLEWKYATNVGDVFIMQKKKVQNAFNSFIDWEWYGSSASFYVKYGMSNTYVTPIWRDYSLLENYEYRINDLLKTMISRGYMPHQVDIAKLCQWVESCEFQARSTGQIDVYDALWEIFKNHRNIMHLYRLSISGDIVTGQGKIRALPEYFFVSKEFPDNMRKFYDKDTTEACWKNENEWKAIFEKMKNSIANASDRYEEGMDAWKNAIAKLNNTLWGKIDNEVERDILAQELSRQWLSTKQSETILNNLDRFNDQWWWSKDNNFFSNSFQYVQNSVQTQVDAFDEALRKILETEEEEAIPMGKLESITNETIQTIDITARARKLFEEHQISAHSQDNSSMFLEGKFIDVHADINQAIRNLTQVKRAAQKVCNDQGNGLGKCDTR